MLQRLVAENDQQIVLAAVQTHISKLWRTANNLELYPKSFQARVVCAAYQRWYRPRLATASERVLVLNDKRAILEQWQSTGVVPDLLVSLKQYFYSSLYAKLRASVQEHYHWHDTHEGCLSTAAQLWRQKNPEYFI